MYFDDKINRTRGRIWWRDGKRSLTIQDDSRVFGLGDWTDGAIYVFLY